MRSFILDFCVYNGVFDKHPLLMATQVNQVFVKAILVHIKVTLAMFLTLKAPNKNCSRQHFNFLPLWV